MRKRKLINRLMASTLAVCLTASCMPVGGNRQVEAAPDNWDEISSIVGRYYGEWTDTSYSGLISNTMPNTALLGNGDVGITSGGNEEEKTFYVSKGDFWEYNARPLPIGTVTVKEAQKEETLENNIAPTYETVEASGYFVPSSGGDMWAPYHAVNGEMQQISNGYGWVTEIGRTHWLTLKFKEPVTIARYVIKNDGAVRSGVAKNNTSDFEIQISDTGEEDSWQTVDSVVGNADDIVDKNLSEAISAQYVRLYITKPTQESDWDSINNPRARIGQFELYSEPKEVEESDNLALNKPIKADMEYVDRRGGVTPVEQMVDGVESTKWCGLEPYPETNHTPTHWAILDLGEMKSISYYKLIHSGIVGETQHNTVDYQLQYLPGIEETNWDTIENDYAEQWADMDVVTGNKKTVTSNVFEEPIQTRYVRLYITKAAPSNTASRIHELELYEEAPYAFYEKQDILNAEIQTKQEIGKIPTDMKTWLAADENIMVTEITSKATADVNYEVRLNASTGSVSQRPISANNTANNITVTRTTKNYPDDAKAHVSKAVLSTTVLGGNTYSTTSDTETGTGTLKFTLGAGETAYIVTAIGGGGRTYHNDGSLFDAEMEPEEEAATILENVADESAVASVNAERQAWWKDFWSASYVDFGTEDENLNKVQKYYYGAQYILGSTVKEDELAPGLYGIWHTTDSASWDSDYHLNYNFMSTFYGTYSSNRPELAVPAAQVLYDFMPEGQRRATSIEELKRVKSDFVDQKIKKGDIDPEKGIEGAILYPVGIGPWGMVIQARDKYLNEALDAAYNSYLMTQYYDYTLDKNFLSENAYEYMKQAVAFYEAWLEREESDENKDGYEYVLYAGYNEGSWAKNPAVELAALKNTLNHLIQFSEDLGKDEDKREHWIDIYEHLGNQPTTNVNGKNVLALGEKQWNGSAWVDLPSPIPGDGNALPLDAMIPGGVYNYFSSPEDLQMIQDTIDVFSARGAWGQINNFPRLFPEAVKARYDVNTVVTKLVDVINRQMAPNLRIADGYHGVEKSGSTETINSMMLQSEEGITKIFPNWYTDKDAKFAHLRAKGAFTVSAEYDGTAQEAKNVTITSEAGEDMTFVSPWAEGMTVKDSKGNVVATTKGTVPNWEDVENATYTFATTAGETYTVEKGETAPEKPSKATLEKFLNQAKEHKANGDVDNCVESVKKLFDEAIAEGEAVMANENTTREEITNATLKLVKAIHALEMKAADKTDLEMTLELAREIAAELDKYVDAGKTEFNEALANGEAVYADGDAFQKEVDAAWDALVEALLNLRLKADKSILEELINEAKTIDLSLYTEESVAVFKKALAAAEDVNADDTLSEDDQKIVDDAVKTLADAKDQLKLKDGSDGDNNGNGNKPSNDKGPKTGDTTSLFVWMAMAVVAAGATVTAVAVKGRKNRRHRR